MVTAMAELKPCPFCDGKAIISWHGWIGVDCTHCTCRIGDDFEFQTEEEATEVWNRRAREEEQDG